MRCRVVRVSSPSSIPSWSDLWAEHGYEGPREDLTGVELECVEGDEIWQEAYAALSLPKNGNCWIEWFEVSEPGEGYGQRIYPLVEKLMRERRCQTSTLYVYHQAESFWLRQGYKKIYPEEDYYVKVLEAQRQ